MHAACQNPPPKKIHVHVSKSKSNLPQNRDENKKCLKPPPRNESSSNFQPSICRGYGGFQKGHNSDNRGLQNSFRAVLAIGRHVHATILLFQQRLNDKWHKETPYSF